MKATRKNRKKAFTLVELVVVIAVIAILAAVLIPTFSSVIKNANNSVDQQLVVQLNLISSTHHTLGNGKDEFEFADNIRKMLDEEGVNKDSLLTKNKDVIIVYNTQTKQFERLKLDGKGGWVAFAESPITYVPYYPEEIFEDYIIVSTEGNDVAEAIYALHNLPSGADNDYVQKAFNKLGDLKDKVQAALENAIIIDEGGNAVAINFSGEPTITTDFSNKTKVIFYEKEQTVTFSSDLHTNNPKLITIVPNNVKIVGDTSEMIFAGNTDGVDGITKNNTCTIAQARSGNFVPQPPVENPCENGHDFDTEKGRIGWTWVEGYTSAEATFICKNNAEHTKSISATITHETKEATCEDGGETVYTATVELDGVKYTDTKTVEISALGHKYVGEWTSDGEGNHYHKCERFDVCKTHDTAVKCSKYEWKYESKEFDGTHWKYCVDCNYVDENTKGQHVFTEWETDEYEHISECDECGAEYYDEHTPAYKQEEEDEGYHIVYCEVCDYEDYEEHDTEGENGGCNKCGKAPSIKPAEDPYFKKVTSTTELVSGAQYLIVYENENGNVALDASRASASLDDVSNTQSVEILNSKIKWSETLQKIVVTIAKSADGNFTIKSVNQGYFIGHTGSKNTINTSTTEIQHSSIAIDSSQNVDIKCGDYYLKFNDASDQMRFRYYQSGQKAIQLYMLVGDTTSGGGTTNPNPDDGETTKTVTYVASSQVSKEVEGVKFTFDKGSASSAPAWYEPAVRMYKNNTLTITAPAGGTITSIEFTFNTTSNNGDIDVTAGGGTYGKSGTIATWVGTSNSVTFTNGKATNQNIQAHITQIVVTYTTSGSTTEPEVKPSGYTLVTSIDQLGDSAEIIIVSGSNAMSITQSNNNRAATSVTNKDGAIVPDDNVALIKLEKVNGGYTLYVTNGTTSGTNFSVGYLYAAGANSNNYLRTRATNSDGNSVWAISFTGNNANIVSQGTATRNTMQLNGSLFACYSSASQTAVQIYMKAA